MTGAATGIDDLREVAPGIYYASQPFVAADEALVAFLKTAARDNPVRRARLCAHPAPDADQHDMLIVSHRETYVAPHRHLNRAETMLVLEGEADAVFFDEVGSVTQCLRMGPVGSGRPFFYRMPPRRFHSLRIHSDVLVFVESTLGPFRPPCYRCCHLPSPRPAPRSLSPTGRGSDRSGRSRLSPDRRQIASA